MWINKKHDMEKQHETIQLLCIVGAVFLIHMSVSFFVRAVYLAQDEFAVTAVTAYFAGEDWSNMVQYLPYYGFGQALLYIPIFLITKNPITRYILMGTVNSALLSTIPVFVYKILESANLTSHRKRCYYAAIVALFPSYLIYTKWLWNETMLCVLPWILLFLILRLAGEKGNKKVDSILLAFLSIYCYAVHGRGILFIVLVLFMICYLWVVRRKRIVDVPFFVASLAVAYIMYDVIKQKLLDNLWLLSEGKLLRNTMSYSLLKIVPKLFDPKKIITNLQTFSGHAMSAMLSSYGLLIVVAVFLLCLLSAKLRKRPSDMLQIPNGNALNYEIILVFSVLSFLGSFAIGCIQMLSQGGDKLIYTRYFDNTLGFVVLVGLLIINETKFLKKRIFVLAVIFLCCIPSYFLITSRVRFDRPFVFFNLYPYLLEGDTKSLFLACIIIMLLFIAILVTARIDKRVNALVLVLIFLEAYYYCGYKYIIPNTDSILEKVITPTEVLAPIQTASKEYHTIYYYDPSFKRGASDGAFQFMLPDYEVVKIKSNILDFIDDEGDIIGEGIVDIQDLGSIPLNSVIYTAEDLQLDLIYRNIYQVTDDRLDSSTGYVWIYGDELNSILTDNRIFTTRNSYGIPKELPLKNFYSMIGEYDNGKIVPSGKSGYLLYGPYMPLSAGKYRVNISGELYAGELDLSSFFDVINGGGSELITSVSDLSQFLHGNEFELQVEFEASEDLPICEFRIYVNEGVQLAITQVTLEYLGGISNDIAVRLDMFSSQNNVGQDDTVVCSNGDQGFLLYGPYIPIEPGSYEITINGELFSGGLDNSSFFDVAAEKGEHIIFREFDLNQFVTGSEFELKVDFTIEESLNDCEFRIFVNEGAELGISQVTLTLAEEN